MGNKKLVSIILCFYNEEKYLAAAIDSVLNQTYTNFELILVSDGSTDRSEEIGDSYSDPRIKRQYLKKNSGLANARNAGYEIANGDYIAHFDGDDILLPDKLQIEVDYLNEHPEIMVVSGGYYLMDKQGIVSKKATLPLLHTDLEIRAGLLFGSFVANAGASMFRREIIFDFGIRNDDTMHWCEDLNFWHQCLPHARFANIDIPFFCYRVNYGSKTEDRVRTNQKKYDEAVLRAFTFAWTSRGFDLAEKDYEFIISHLFRGERRRISEISYEKKLKRKISKQSAILQLDESDAILNLFSTRMKRTYYSTAVKKKIVNTFAL